MSRSEKDSLYRAFELLYIGKLFVFQLNLPVTFRFYLFISASSALSASVSSGTTPTANRVRVP